MRSVSTALESKPGVFLSPHILFEMCTLKRKIGQCVCYIISVKWCGPIDNMAWK
jgi:hypothetical protein